MAQYLRVVRRGKHNVRVELPDHTTQLVPVSELPLWELVVALANNSQSSQNSVEVVNLDAEMASIDQESIHTPQNETANTSEVEDSPTEEVKENIKKEGKENKPKREKKEKKTDKASYKAGNFRKNTNGLGIDHPYEMVDTNVESVEYSEGVESPF